MPRLRKDLIALLFIGLVALMLRTWQLADIPGGLTWDEAGLGYNAYSLLKTGKDEHGVSWPLVFKSFGDFKPGAYVYWSLPFVAAFDLSEFSVRLPSAIAGVLAIFGIYLLADLVLPDLALKFRSFKISLGLIAAAVLAVSPWHLFYSRGAWEVNLFATILIFALYFWIKFLRGSGHLWPSLLLAVLTFYTYQAGKLLTPLLFIWSAWIYRDNLKLWTKSLTPWRSHWLTLSLFATVLIFTGYQNLFAESGNRLTRLSIFNYQPGISAHDAEIDGDLAGLFHSQSEQTLRLIASRYLYHFSPEVLFYEGSVITDRGHIPRLGMLYMIEVVFLLVGISYAWRHSSLLLGLLLLSPVPASLTLAEFSTTRSLFTVIPLVILIAIGLYQFLTQTKIWRWVLPVLFLANIIYGLDIYFHHSQKVWAFEFNYGHKQAVEAIMRYPNANVVFTDLYGQPYIYYLFYSKYDPLSYQAQNRFVDGGVDVGHVARIDNIEFRQFSLQDIQLSKNMLFIGSPVNLPDEFLPRIDNIEYYQQIDLESHRPIFRIIKTQ